MVIGYAYCLLVIMFLPLLIPAPMQPTSNKPHAISEFSLAADWGGFDDYGQGIQRLKAYENSTGSWVAVSGADWTYSDTVEAVEWEAGVSIKIRAYTYVNCSLLGVSSNNPEAAKPYFRHWVNVTNRQGVQIWNKQNFTYVDWDSDAPLILYTYDVILNFLPAALQSYTVTVNYEVYYAPIGDVVLYNEFNSLTDVTFDSKSAAVGAGEYGAASVDGALEIWVDLDSTSDEYVIYHWDCTNFATTDRQIVIRWQTEDTGFYFYCRPYYDDASYDDLVAPYGESIGDWTITSFDLDTGKTLDHVRLYANDDPNTINAGNLSVSIDWIYIYDLEATDWYDSGEAELYFNLLSNNLSGWFVLLGLCMIAGSPMYLAIAKKTDTLSMDKFYIFLVAFIFGWALLIGGIAP